MSLRRSAVGDQGGEVGEKLVRDLLLQPEVFERRHGRVAVADHQLAGLEALDRVLVGPELGNCAEDLALTAQRAEFFVDL